MTNRQKLGTNITIGVMLVTLFFISVVSNGAHSEVGLKNIAIYSGNTANNNITLMVNVYWGEEYLPSMLDTFKANNVKTTFFIGGMWIDKNIELLKKIYDEGHEIGNHGYTHKDAEKLSYDKNFEEMNKTNLLIKEKLGHNVALYAPPSGSIGANMFMATETLNMKVIMWSKDTIDWRDKDTEIIFNRATKKLKNGDLILMHPTKNTAEALPRIVKSIKEQGFNLNTVSKNIE